MSGLSLADMRRIGAERNHGALQEKPARKGLLARLPFVRPQGSDGTPSPSSALARSAPAAGARSLTPPALPVPQSERSAAHQISEAAVRKALAASVTRHAGAGATVTALLGLAASGAPLALPAGALLGGLVGNAIARRAQSIPSDRAPRIIVTRKKAVRLFEALETAAGLVAAEPSTLRVAIDQSAGVRAVAVAGKRGAPPRGYLITIGLAALCALDLRQIDTLVAHALVMAREVHGGGLVHGESAQRMEALAGHLANRRPPLRLDRLARVKSRADDARASFQLGLGAATREADGFAARYAGPRALVEALLAQALLAARMLDELETGRAFADVIAHMRLGLGSQDLDSALRRLARSPVPGPGEARFGLPIHLLERMNGLDTSCAVPMLPAAAPAMGVLDERFAGKLLDRLAAPAKEKAKAPRSARSVKPTRADRQTRKPAKAQRPARDAKGAPGLFGRLFGRSKTSSMAGAQMPALMGAAEPLYHADTLYKNDPALGLEAYASLVAAHPRWALARLRLAEAQLELGFPDCVGNLMTCAEHLPSALPTILDRLQSALAMISPLDGEPLRRAIETMQTNADAIAAERAHIELEALAPCTLDTQDREALVALFAQMAGLREVWVLGAPCAFMAEVPHHAIIGLAPRLGADDAQGLAMTIAEHAAITGTVAVHLETGTPRGALGDTLATYPSLWRMGTR